MILLDSGRPPGGERFTPKKEKPGGKPGFRNNKNETQSTTLPPYKKVAQLRALLRKRHAVIQNCLPLEIGIHEAILTAYPEQGKTAIRRVLKFHTSSRAYLKNLAAGGHRYDLAGQPWGRITPEHQRQAQEQLKNPRAKLVGPPSQKAVLPHPAAEGTAPLVLNTQALNRPRLRLKKQEDQS